jgi:hypothetical protein
MLSFLVIYFFERWEETINPNIPTVVDHCEKLSDSTNVADSNDDDDDDDDGGIANANIYDGGHGDNYSDIDDENLLEIIKIMVILMAKMLITIRCINIISLFCEG